MDKALSDYLQVDKDLASSLSEPLKERKVECDLCLTHSALFDVQRTSRCYTVRRTLYVKNHHYVITLCLNCGIYLLTYPLHIV